MDPALIALSLLDVLALAATRSWPTDPHVHVRSRTDLYDEHGRDAGGWRTVAALSRTGGGVRLDGQLLDHVVRVEPGERVVAVDAPWAVLAQAVGEVSVLLSGAWDARTGRGNGYRGVAATVVDGWLSRGSEQVVQLRFDRIEITRANYGTGEAVQIAGQFTTDHLTAQPR